MEFLQLEVQAECRTSVRSVRMFDQTASGQKGLGGARPVRQLCGAHAPPKKPPAAIRTIF